MTTETEDPWKEIMPPDRAATVSAKRVDPSLSWDMFWAVEADRTCLLILQHRKETRPPRRLPKLRGLQVEAYSADQGPHDRLIVRLKDREQREIFHRLCLDIIAATGSAKTEEQAIARFLTRTWRWHRLLMGGRDGRLSDEEQKGLIGELVVLEKHLIPVLGISTAVRCWKGPLGTPKDFEIGRTCIEAKARRGTATPHVKISSEHQLDSADSDNLFLHVTEITAATDDTGDPVTISKIVERLHAIIADQDPATVDLFEALLAAIGFDWDDDYSDKRWLIGREDLFEVRDDFPRITPFMYPGGVSDLRYSISLPDCEPFRVDIENLIAAISGGCDDN